MSRCAAVWVAALIFDAKPILDITVEASKHRSIEASKHPSKNYCTFLIFLQLTYNLQLTTYKVGFRENFKNETACFLLISRQVYTFVLSPISNFLIIIATLFTGFIVLVRG